MSADDLQPWKTKSRRTLLNYSRFLKVEVHEVALPDGQIIDNWPWIIIPDAAIVVAKTKSGHYLCFRQTKYAVEDTTLAPVGGMVEKNEDPLAAAKRELVEETGYQAERWISLGSYALDPNRGVNVVNLFFAYEAEKVGSPSSDDLEDQDLLKLTRDEVLIALRKGEFKVLSWTAAFSMALAYEEFWRQA